MTAAAQAQASPFAIFRNRNFSLMWSAQLISTIGSALTSLAASILIFRLTGSALSVGLMLMATAAPHITGIVALIRAKHPELTPFQIKTVLLACAANSRHAAGR